MVNNPVAHIERPLIGSDIEGWRNTHGLSMADATYALGFPNYKNKLMMPGLEFPVELLMRLYDEDPSHGVWPRYRISLPWLFNEMYKDILEPFRGGPHEVTARVDVQARFARLFGRSKGRAYRWLDEDEVDSSISNRTQATIQAILGKLSQLEDPGATLNRLATFIWHLRGEDIDITHPIPSLKAPPTREQRGRKPSFSGGSQKLVRRSISSDADIKIKPSKVALLKAKDAEEKPAKAEKVKAPKSEKIDIKIKKMTPLDAMISGKVKVAKPEKAAPVKASSKVLKGGKNV